MKIFLETPALRFFTKKFAEAVQDLDTKIADSPVLSTLLGVEKQKGIFQASSPVHTRDIKPFLNKKVIEETVKLSMKLEDSRRRKSFLAQRAYETPEGAIDSIWDRLLNPDQDWITKELSKRLESQK